MTTRLSEIARILWESPYVDHPLTSKSTALLVAAMDRLAAAILCAIFWGLAGAVLGGLAAVFVPTSAAQVAGTAALIGGSFGVGLSSNVSHALKATGILKITLIGTLTVGLGLLLGFAIVEWFN